MRLLPLVSLLLHCAFVAESLVADFARQLVRAQIDACSSLPFSRPSQRSSQWDSRTKRPAVGTLLLLRLPSWPSLQPTRCALLLADLTTSQWLLLRCAPLFTFGLPLCAHRRCGGSERSLELLTLTWSLRGERKWQFTACAAVI